MMFPAEILDLNNTSIQVLLFRTGAVISIYCHNLSTSFCYLFQKVHIFLEYPKTRNAYFLKRKTAFIWHIPKSILFVLYTISVRANTINRNKRRQRISPLPHLLIFNLISQSHNLYFPNKPVPYSSYCLDKFRMSGVLLQFLSQSTHQAIDYVFCISRLFLFINFPVDLGMGKYLTRLFNQKT